MIFHDFGKFAFEMLWIDQVTETNTTTRYLVFIGRADATTGGADGLVAAFAFTCLIQGHVIWQDQRAGLTDLQTPTGRHAHRFQLGHLFQQCLRRQHHAIANQALHVVAQNPGWDQV